MIYLTDVLETFDYKITDGAAYLWSCYGSNARSIDYWNNEYSNGGVCIHGVFDTQDQLVYELQVWDHTNNREYRWIHPSFIEEYKAESARRNIPFDVSSDGRKFIDLDVTRDILEKTRAIYLGVSYDTRVAMDLDLSDEEMFSIMTAAHEADMTLNNYIEKILREAMNKS